MTRTIFRRRATGAVVFVGALALAIAVQSPWTIAIAVIAAVGLALIAFVRALDTSIEPERRIGGSADGRRLPGPGEDAGIGPGAS